MDPRQFYELASELANGTKVVQYRTAISRAYYGAYNVCVAILQEMGFQTSKGPGGHGEVQNRLGNSGDGEVERVGSQLTDLHARRIQADYRMEKRDVETQATARALVEQAGRMIQTLEGCRSEPKRTQITNAIRSWEQKVSGAGS